VATTENIKNLTINNVESREVFDYMLSNGLVMDNELYLVHGENSTVLYTPQSLTEEQMEQVRANIGAVSSADVQVIVNGLGALASKDIVEKSDLAEDVQNILNNTTTKEYVNNKSEEALPKAGGTMTGALTLAADPTENLQAATKQYVDNNSGGKNVWYGTCDTAAATAAKAVTTDSNFQLDTGVILFVTFTNAHSTSSMTLSVNGGTAVTVYKNGTTKIDSGMVAANETICFIYDGTYFRMENGSAASTSQYGLVKLSSSTSSTSTSLAATPSAVKQAYDLANGANTTASEAKTAVEELANEVVYINEEDNENIEDPQDSTDTKIAEHNTDATAHSDIRDTIPTKVSDLTNDSGFITSHQDISGKLDKSGDTMTGAITLPGAPTEALHAATKQYVDDNKYTHPSTHPASMITGLTDIISGLGYSQVTVGSYSGNGAGGADFGSGNGYGHTLYLDGTKEEGWNDAYLDRVKWKTNPRAIILPFTPKLIFIFSVLTPDRSIRILQNNESIFFYERDSSSNRVTGLSLTKPDTDYNSGSNFEYVLEAIKLSGNKLTVTAGMLDNYNQAIANPLSYNISGETYYYIAFA
jgi:hypothetical protein